jgi:hypothetical protein
MIRTISVLLMLVRCFNLWGMEEPVTAKIVEEWKKPFCQQWADDTEGTIFNEKVHKYNQPTNFEHYSEYESQQEFFKLITLADERKIFTVQEEEIYSIYNDTYALYRDPRSPLIQRSLVFTYAVGNRRGTHRLLSYHERTLTRRTIARINWSTCLYHQIDDAGEDRGTTYKFDLLKLLAVSLPDYFIGSLLNEQRTLEINEGKKEACVLLVRLLRSYVPRLITNDEKKQLETLEQVAPLFAITAESARTDGDYRWNIDWAGTQ